MENVPLRRYGFIRHRRPRRPLCSTLVLLAFTFALTVQGAAAGRGWCRTDPIVSIDDRLADVFVAAPPEALLLVTGPNQIVVTVPVGVRASLVIADVGFGKGDVVSFRESSRLRRTKTGIQVVIRVYVPATDPTMPVRVEFARGIVGILAPASAEGTANKWISLKTKL
jgi:hypothetical protein